MNSAEEKLQLFMEVVHVARKVLKLYSQIESVGCIDQINLHGPNIATIII